MKNILFAISILTIFCFAKCKKDKTDFNGLPAATQEGKNTLGFLLNGQPWTPKGFSGTANLSIDVDLEYNQGGFGIGAYRNINGTHISFGIGVRDSLNFFQIPNTFLFHKNSLAVSRTHIHGSCEIDFFDTTVHREGNLSITKLDKINRIISGTFNATMYKPGCDTIKITEGRFDMKF